MILRMKSNALRFRLSNAEISILATSGILSEKVNFGETTLSYTLKITDIASIKASLYQNHILVEIPTSTFKDWVQSNHIKIETTLYNQQLSILIEKDLFDEKKRKRKG